MTSVQVCRLWPYVCFDFGSNNLHLLIKNWTQLTRVLILCLVQFFTYKPIVQLSNRNPYFYWFRCHHPLITQLTLCYPDQMCMLCTAQKFNNFKINTFSFLLHRMITFKNGILLPKLLWPTVRKYCSRDRGNLLKFEAGG